MLIIGKGSSFYDSRNDMQIGRIVKLTRHWWLILFLFLSNTIWCRLAYSKEPNSNVGTAFFFRKDGAMLTNRHVVEGCEKVVVVPSRHDEKQYSAKILALSNEYDLAVIKINGYEPVTIAVVRAFTGGKYVSIPVDGEQVMTGGTFTTFDHDTGINIVDGIALGIKTYSEKGATSSIMLSSTGKGASGSAVIGDGGHLIGVIHSVVEEPDIEISDDHAKYDGLAYFYNNNAIVDFLTKEGIKFHFLEASTRKLSRFERVGYIYNISALVKCEN